MKSAADAHVGFVVGLAASNQIDFLLVEFLNNDFVYHRRLLFLSVDPTLFQIAYS
jgi:hypothetical protein